MNYSDLIWRLDRLAESPVIEEQHRNAVRQAAVTLSELNSALSFLGDDALYTMRHVYAYAGLVKEWATQVLEGFDPEATVAEAYNDNDSTLEHAIRGLIGPDFEYPDWSHKTVGEVLEIFK